MGSFFSTIGDILRDSGVGYIINNFMEGGWRNLVMIIIACVLLYLAIVKKFEPLLLLPIAFGVLIANLPLANLTSKYTVEGLTEMLNAAGISFSDFLKNIGMDQFSWNALAENAQKMHLL